LDSWCSFHNEESVSLFFPLYDASSFYLCLLIFPLSFCLFNSSNLSLFFRNFKNINLREIGCTFQMSPCLTKWLKRLLKIKLMPNNSMLSTSSLRASIMPLHICLGKAKSNLKFKRSYKPTTMLKSQAKTPMTKMNTMVTTLTMKMMAKVPKVMSLMDGKLKAWRY
jgi:hypothetical protein